MEDIENEDFDEAYIKAQSIKHTSPWSDEVEEKWENTRKEMIGQIIKAEKEAINSIKKLGDDLFFLEWTGDYGLDDFLAEGGAKDNEELAEYLGEAFEKGKWTSPKNQEDSKIKITVPEYACSSIAAKTENGHAIFGRNYDWAKDSTIMIVHTKPDNGYESVSTSSMEFFGVQKGWEPTGNFREDLYYRLNVVHIEVPPLRDRKEDIPLLVADFIKTYAKENGKNIEGIDNKTRSILYNYDWPGNIRQLKNCIESAVVMCQGNIITVEDLPPGIATGNESESIKIPLGISMEEAEKIIITENLAANNGNKSKTADILQIGRKTLHRKLEEYNL